MVDQSESGVIYRSNFDAYLMVMILVKGFSQSSAELCAVFRGVKKKKIRVNQRNFAVKFAKIREKHCSMVK